MREHWERVTALCESGALRPELRRLGEGPLVRCGEALVLEELLEGGFNPEDDATAIEAFVNKIHVEDYAEDATGVDLVAQGVLYGKALAPRLAAQGGRFRVVVSWSRNEDDSSLDAVTVRFFERRAASPWGSDDPDAYPLEALVFLDT